MPTSGDIQRDFEASTPAEILVFHMFMGDFNVPQIYHMISLMAEAGATVEEIREAWDAFNRLRKEMGLD